MSLIRTLLEDRREIRDSKLSELLARDRGLGTFAGIAVSEASALVVGAYWACVSLLVESISTLPVHAYRRDGKIRRPLLTQPSVVEKPSAVLSQPEWVGQIVYSAITEGNGFGQVTARNALGFATQVEVRSHRDVVVTREGRTGPPVYRIDSKRVSIDDVFHVRGLMLDGEIVGISALTKLRETLGLGLASNRYVQQWFGNGGHPSGVLESTKNVNREAATRIKNRFLAAVRKREPVVLGMDLKYRAIQANPSDAAFIEAANWVVQEVTRFFRIPVEMINGATAGGGSITYNNREQRALDLVTFAVMPWLVRIEAPWSGLLPKPQFVRFTVDGLLRSDTKARYDAHGVAIRSGFRTPNRALELENEEPFEGGDTYLWPPYSTSAPKEASNGQDS